MTGSFLLYLAAGKLLIWTGQKFIAANAKTLFFRKLFDCDFCWGVWVYSALALLFKITIMTDVFPYVPFVSEVVAGVISSFVVHLLTIGWREKFSVIVI